jgi:hypothetical protein
MNKVKMLAALILNVFSLPTLAASATIIPDYHDAYYAHQITKIYQTSLANKAQDLPTRIDRVTAGFLGKPYLLGALGEGHSGQFDQSPLYRTDAFDCLTFVSTTLALIEGHNPQEFLHHLKQIQYKNGQVSFADRYHFVDLDWNFYNEEQGYLKDITQEIDPSASVATAVEDQSAWFQQLPADTLKSVTRLSDMQQQSLLTKLHHEGDSLAPRLSRTAYIPVTHLYQGGPNTIANKDLFNRIPNGAIIEIVNKNHPFKAQIGTDLNVSHLGFAIWKDGVLIFRHASIVQGQVVNVPLAQYLEKYYYLPNPQNVGIHVSVPLMKH